MARAVLPELPPRPKLVSVPCDELALSSSTADLAFEGAPSAKAVDDASRTVAVKNSASKIERSRTVDTVLVISPPSRE
jgi:hypothetical protein